MANLQKRIVAGKMLYKLMDNDVNSKTIVNLRHRIDVRLVKKRK